MRIVWHFRDGHKTRDSIASLGRILFSWRKAKVSLPVTDKESGGEIATLVDGGTGTALAHDLVEHSIVTVLFRGLMEDVDHIEVLPQFTGEVIPQLLDESKPLQRDTACGFCSTLEISGMVYHILLQHLNERTTRVDNDGLVLPFRRFDVSLNLIKILADRGCATVRRFYSADAIVEVQQERVWCGTCKVCLAYAG